MKKAWTWYTFCRKHLKLIYNPKKDGYCKADTDVTNHFSCGAIDTIGKCCKNKVVYEYYPNIMRKRLKGA